MNFADKAISFFSGLSSSTYLPGKISVLNPYMKDEVRKIISSFYKKFYADDGNRLFIFGINPGRFGGGLTGISFTDPVALRLHCGIDNQLSNQLELSSKFVYKAIDKFGGTEKFFTSFYLSALYPLALIQDGKNINFYDSKEIFNSLKEEIICSFKKQIAFGAHAKAVICLGKKNARYLTEINDELKYFNEICILEHPRYIMQYKLKQLEQYLNEYMRTFDYCLKLISREEAK